MTRRPLLPARRVATALALAGALAACSHAAPAAPGTATPDAPAAAAEAKLTVQSYAAGEHGFHVTSTLVLGTHDAVLVDAQFLDSDAQHVADAVRASGRRLTAIYITHAHPDHYFGLAVLHAAFPEAKILAHPTVAAEMKEHWQAKHDQWKPMFGADLSDTRVDATPYDAPTLALEGRELELIGPEQGDTDHDVIVHVPDAHALVTGDVSYAGVHVWLADSDPAGWTRWLATLERLEKLGATTVVSGHRAPGRGDDAGDLAATERYIRTFQDARAKAASPEALVATVRAAYPTLALPIILDIAAKAAFARPDAAKPAAH